jgi:branched-chain amino acid transport system ATP-binding protein
MGFGRAALPDSGVRSAREVCSEMGMTPVLSARNLQTYYGENHILHGVSLDVHEGEIVAVLGRNGSGKTTTLRSLTGLMPPRAGTIELLGRDITHWPTYRIARLGLGYVPEGRRIFGNLSVLENLRAVQTNPGTWTLRRIFDVFPRLEERQCLLGCQLAGAEQEMLAIALPLLLNPRIILVDEPSQGLAPSVVQDLMAVVRRMSDEGVSVLLVEQNARLSLAIADRAYVLDNGFVIFSGRADEAMSDVDLQRRYLIM